MTKPGNFRDPAHFISLTAAVNEPTAILSIGRVTHFRSAVLGTGREVSGPSAGCEAGQNDRRLLGARDPSVVSCLSVWRLGAPDRLTVGPQQGAWRL